MTTRKPRWWLLATILIVAAVAEIVVWSRYAEDASQQMIATLIVVISTLALVLIWWLGLSRLAWRVRLAGVAALALAVGLFLGLFRYEGFRGDFSPIFEIGRAHV